MLKLIKENFGWIKDIVIVIGIVGMLYLNQNFVTNSKFDAHVKSGEASLESVRVSLSTIDKTLALMQQNQSILIENEKQIGINTIKVAEHESLIRQLQQLHMEAYIQADSIKNAEMEIRLKNIEKNIAAQRVELELQHQRIDTNTKKLNP